MEHIKVSEPFPLTGAFNCRDLGGYPTTDGHITKTGRFIRSAALDCLSPEDKSFLYDYGVRCVIDLRSDDECTRQPCALIDYKDIEYVHIPMLDHVQSDEFMGLLPTSMSEMYTGLLAESGELIALVFRKMLSYTSDCIIFNCSAGKDRTGTIAMLLLLLNHVPKDIVIADYAASRKNLEPLITRQKAIFVQMGLDIPDYVMDSVPEEMEKTLDFIASEYGDIENYLEKIGLTAAEIDELKFT